LRRQRNTGTIVTGGAGDREKDSYRSDVRMHPIAVAIADVAYMAEVQKNSQDQPPLSWEKGSLRPTPLVPLNRLPSWAAYNFMI
jgi:hypothetical protein